LKRDASFQSNGGKSKRGGREQNKGRERHKEKGPNTPQGGISRTLPAREGSTKTGDKNETATCGGGEKKAYRTTE